MTTATKCATGPCRPDEPLPDVRHEKFVRLLVEGRRLGEAYRQAGFASKSPGAARANACRLAARPEVAARRMHLRLKAAADAGGPVSRETKVAILEGLIRDQSLTPADRLRAIEAHTKFAERDEGDRTPPDPATVAAWLADDEEYRTPEHLAKVLACLARTYHVTPERLAGIAGGVSGGAPSG